MNLVVIDNVEMKGNDHRAYERSGSDNGRSRWFASRSGLFEGIID
jgi:hypothetical protein